MKKVTKEAMENDLDDLIAQLDFIPDLGVPMEEGIALEEMGQVPEVSCILNFLTV